MNVIDIIMKWENQYDFFSQGRVEDFDFYSYLRRELVNTAVNAKNGVSTDPFESKGQKDTGARLFFKLLKRNEKPPVKNVDLLILCHPRRQKEGDKYESVFTDFLEEEFPNSVTLERLFDDHSHFEPPLTKNICYVDKLTLNSYVYRIMMKTFHSKEYNEIKTRVQFIMDEPLRELESYLDVPLKRESYFERATTLFFFRKYRRQIYSRFLEEVNPRAMVEVVSKSVDALILNELCRERGIPVIELQHSLLGPIAKYPEGIVEKESPDYYLSYSDYWSEYQTYPIKKDHVFSCGSPYFERQVAKYKKEKTPHNKIRVLFISGTAYGEKLSTLAVELAKAAGDKVEILYKLHPDEFGRWAELYPGLMGGGIKVIDSKDVSIYEYFSDVDAQVGVFSTALYEGIAFDISTYILNIPFAAEFIDFCRDGYGILVENGEQLAQSLLNKEKPKKSAAEITERFWKSNARENIVKTIREITGL